jgi:hypothetical protein
VKEKATSIVTTLLTSLTFEQHDAKPKTYVWNRKLLEEPKGVSSLEAHGYKMAVSA